MPKTLYFNEAEEALEKAKVHLMTKQGSMFLSSISVMLQHEISEEVSTAATNGIFIKYNPDFFYKLTKKQRVGLIAHEVWHVAFMHMCRINDRDPLIWNYAGDYVINGLLTKNSFELPPNGCFDLLFDNWSTDQVYEYLIQNKIEPPPNYSSDLIKGGNSVPNEEVEQTITNTVIKATNRVLLEGGNVPAEITVAIDKLINPRLNWKELLYRFVDAKTKEDYTWSRPNRKYLPSFYLPSRYSNKIQQLTIAIDTSGSMTDEFLQEILTEIQYINETLQPENMTVLDCDSVIHNIYHVTSNDSILDFKFSGGGGTSFKPVIRYCNENDTNVLLYFTDLEASQITKQQPFPILWICSTNHEPAPIGDTIYVHN